MRICVSCGLLLTVLLGLSACGKKQVGRIPSIILTSAGPYEMRGGSFEDTAIIKFHFEDGDGDIGGQGTVTLIDTRDTNTRILDFPEIPDEVKDPYSNTVTGDCTLLLLASEYLLPRPDSLHINFGDTLSFRFYVQDAAGNRSNELTAGPFYLKP